MPVPLTPATVAIVVLAVVQKPPADEVNVLPRDWHTVEGVIAEGGGVTVTTWVAYTVPQANTPP